MAERLYAFSESTIMSFDQYELALRDDHTFELGCASSDPAGSMGGYAYAGTWTQTAEQIVLSATRRTSAGEETAVSKVFAARFVGDELAIDGIAVSRVHTNVTKPV